MRTVRQAAWPLLLSLLPLSVIAGWAALAGGPASAAAAPRAGISISPGAGPLSVKFNAVATGFPSPVTAYRWTFGDGTSKTTSANTVGHTYKSASTFSVSVTETGSGGGSATARGRLELFLCPAGSSQCTATLQSPGPVRILSASGPVHPGTAASLALFTDPWRFPNCDAAIQTAAAVTDSGFSGPLAVTLVYQTAHPKQVPTTCFSSDVAFTDAAGLLVHSGPLPACQAAVPVPPCVQSVQLSGSQVMKQLLIPPGDPRIGAP